MAWLPFLITLIVFCFVGFVSYLRFIENMEMIRKGLTPIKTKAPSPGSFALFFGLVSTSIGAALLIAALLNTSSGDLFIFGLVLTFIGVALFTYWKLTAKDRKRAQELFENQIAQRVAEPKDVQPETPSAPVDVVETVEPEQTEGTAQKDDTTNILE